MIKLYRTGPVSVLGAGIGSLLTYVIAYPAMSLETLWYRTILVSCIAFFSVVLFMYIMALWDAFAHSVCPRKRIIVEVKHIGQSVGDYEDFEGDGYEE